MKALKKLFNTKTKIFVGIAIFALLLTWIFLFIFATDTAVNLIGPVLWSVLVIAICFLAIHFGMKAWRKRKRSEFDEKVAAKEGIEDRRREWAQWTDELDKQGIDRYELPFYLLVGEPQSGKSVLLHNSDLHFPFGQNRLSGVGGTRGCDWWFTEEAVVLDLAGRLFTHEGGAADRVEFESFLEMLSEFRPLCPANGVILVIPCDGLLTDDADECALKATKIQNALLTLTTKLEAQLPVYVVLTKGDQIFGFAESVHRLDVERRHEMFGWSRPAENIDSPFDIKEVLDGFGEMVTRARLLRSHMGAGARLPEALPEMDRMIAFPHELEGMGEHLEIYLKRIFTASNITDRVFFRGLYLTSGLQAGVPIAKVCSDLFGTTGEADSRSLEALFSKPRAYFIKDLIRTRVFGERGLVRPTQGRVQQTRRAGLIGYGISGAIVLASFIFAAVVLSSEVEGDRSNSYERALRAAEECIENPPEEATDIMNPLQLLKFASIDDVEQSAKAFKDPREDFKELYCELFDASLMPRLKLEALGRLERKFERQFKSFQDLRTSCNALAKLSGVMDLNDKGTREAIVQLLYDMTAGTPSRSNEAALNLEEALRLRMDWSSDEAGLRRELTVNDRKKLKNLAGRALGALEHSLEPGHPSQPVGEFGYMLAWYGAEEARKALKSSEIAGMSNVLQQCELFSNSLRKLEELEPKLPSSSGGGTNTIKLQSVVLKGYEMMDMHTQFQKLERGINNDSEETEDWYDMVRVMQFTFKKFEGHYDDGIGLSDAGLQFGATDLGQTVFVKSAEKVKQAQGEIDIGILEEDYAPLLEYKGDNGSLIPISHNRLPLDLEGGGLKGLSAKIEDIDQRHLVGATGAGKKVFGGQISQVAELFKKQINSPQAAVRAVTGQEVVEPGLCVPLVRELNSLHAILGTLPGSQLAAEALAADAARSWQIEIEKILEDHLRESNRDLKWLRPNESVRGFVDETWETLGALGGAAALKPRERNELTAVAVRIQATAFFDRADDLLDSWVERPEGLEGTEQICKDLDSLAGRVRSLSVGANLDGPDLNDWAGRLDTMLTGRLNGLEKQLTDIWHPPINRQTFRSALAQASSCLDTLDDKIAQSQDLVVIDRVAANLAPTSDVGSWLELPQTKAIVSHLAQWKIPAKASHVRGSPEFGRLSNELDNINRLPASSMEGAALAQTLFEYFPPTVGELPPAENAAIRMVRYVRSELTAVLVTQVRTDYLEELTEKLRSRVYEELYAVLFWRPGAESEEDFFTGKEERQLDELLERNRGGFDKLRKDYHLITKSGDPKLENLIFPPLAVGDPAPEEEGGNLHGFLLDLREFLLEAEDKRPRRATVSFYLTPSQESHGTIWHLKGDEATDRSVFWYPTGKVNGDLQRGFMSEELEELEVKEWSLDSNKNGGRRLVFLWSDQLTEPEARSNPDTFSFEAPSALAPLLLAWSGEPSSDDSTRFEFQVDLKGTELQAPFEISFDKPLPPRPPGLGN